MLQCSMLEYRINEFSKDIKNKYKVVNLEDMKEDSKDLFSNIF